MQMLANIFLGPLNIVTHNASTNFNFMKFHTKAKIFNLYVTKFL